MVGMLPSTPSEKENPQISHHLFHRYNRLLPFPCSTHFDFSTRFLPPTSHCLEWALLAQEIPMHFGLSGKILWDWPTLDQLGMTWSANLVAHIEAFHQEGPAVHYRKEQIQKASMWNTSLIWISSRLDSAIARITVVVPALW
jgi:hypothetical protein